MHHYNHHIGDYAEATGHLSILEDGVYGRLLRKYYATEAPLPADMRRVQRLVGARTKEELAAVETVLQEFFALRDDGWHQGRCDAEIAAYQAGEPERVMKRANEKGRTTRHRQERALLFKALHALGQHPDWNMKMGPLRELAARYGVGAETAHAAAHAAAHVGAPATAPATGVPLPATPPDTAPATPATANQSPVTNHQSPITNIPSGEGMARASAGEACRAMRQAGLADTNPSHPTLVALLAGGITLDELAAAARDAAKARKPFAWALKAAEGRRRDAAAMGPLPAALPGTATGATGVAGTARQTTYDRRAATLAGLSNTGEPDADHDRRDGRTVDVEAHLVG